MENLTSILQKWRVRLGHVFSLIILFFAQPTIPMLAVGTAVTILGLAMRMAAAGCIQKDQVLSRHGPYAYTRNPLYLGSFFMVLGFCIAAGNLWVILAFFPFFFGVYYATIYREEQFLHGRFGNDYARFCSEVPRFFPRLTPAVRGGGGWFSMQQAMANHEYEGAGAALVLLAILWALALTGFFPFHAVMK
jgi:protein-S-isoprenylcysteine O-methyltransferase Ste14